MNTFSYRIGGAALVPGDEAILAKFDMVVLNRFFHDDINGNTWGALRNINPDIEIYLYQLGKATSYVQDSKPDRGLNTIARWNDGRGHSMGDLNVDNSNLFLLDSSSNRIHNAEYTNSWFLDFGSTDFQKYWLEATITDIVGPPFTSQRPWTADGVFLDVCSSIMTQSSATPVKYNTAAKWSAAMNNFASNITIGLHNVNQKAFINRGQSRTADGYKAWIALDANATTPDVVFEEGAFATLWGPKDVQFYPEDEWLRQIELMSLVRNSKVAYQSSSDLAKGQNGYDNYDKPVSFRDILWYSLGSYLIGKNTLDNNSFFAFSESYNEVNWYDEYDHIDLGNAMGDHNVTNYSGRNIYWREFEKGFVFVNPTKSDVSSIELPEPCKLLNYNNIKNNPNTLQIIKTISLKSHRAAILLKETFDFISLPLESTQETTQNPAPATPGPLTAPKGLKIIGG